MTPPRAAYDAARCRTLRAATALRWGLVVYDDREYECAVSIDGEGWDVSDMGQRVRQRIKVSFAKRDLAARPRTGATIYHQDKAYEIELVGGDHLGDPHWSVVGVRTPGGDV